MTAEEQAAFDRWRKLVYEANLADSMEGLNDAGWETWEGDNDVDQT